MDELMDQSVAFPVEAGTPAGANMLLGRLSPADLAELSPEEVTLRAGDMLLAAHQPLDAAWFLTSGIASIIMTANGEALETGIVGREGFIGHGLVLGAARSPQKVLIQVEGAALRVPGDRLLRVAAAVPDFDLALRRFLHAFMIQLAETALSVGRATVEARLARWILMCDDRIKGPHIHLTHQFMAAMLGVRRASVTSALHMLEGDHLIRSTRSHILVVDREGLRKRAGVFYGQAVPDLPESRA